MTDITELFSFLMPDKAAEEAIAASDPFLPLKAAPDLISQLVLKESGNQDYSTTDKVIAGLLSGLGSGYLGQLSSDYQTKKLADYTSLLPQMASGTVTGKPEGMSQDVFNIAQKKANQYDIFQKLQSDENARAVESQKTLEAQKSNIGFAEKLREKAVLAPTGPERRRAWEAYLQFTGQSAAGAGVDDSIGANVDEEVPSSLTSIVGEEGAKKYNSVLNELGPKEASIVLKDLLKEQSKAKSADGAPKMGVEATDKFVKANALTNEMLTMADKLDSGKQGWLGFQMMQQFSALDKEGIAVQLDNLVDYITRSRTGAALNKEEQVIYRRMLAGDKTASPKVAAVILRKLAAGNARLLGGELDTRSALSTDYTKLRQSLKDIDTQYGNGIDERRAFAAAAKAKGLTLEEANAEWSRIHGGK